MHLTIRERLSNEKKSHNEKILKLKASLFFFNCIKQSVQKQDDCVGRKFQSI